jgi:hypothetical protein
MSRALLCEGSSSTPSRSLRRRLFHPENRSTSSSQRLYVLSSESFMRFSARWSVTAGRSEDRTLNLLGPKEK